MGNAVLSWLGKRIANYLTKEIPGYEPSTPPDFASLSVRFSPAMCFSSKATLESRA